jgi:hypothetical protein
MYIFEFLKMVMLQLLSGGHGVGRRQADQRSLPPGQIADQDVPIASCILLLHMNALYLICLLSASDYTVGI